MLPLPAGGAAPLDAEETSQAVGSSAPAWLDSLLKCAAGAARSLVRSEMKTELRSRASK